MAIRVGTFLLVRHPHVFSHHKRCVGVALSQAISMFMSTILSGYELPDRGIDHVSLENVRLNDKGDNQADHDAGGGSLGVPVKV